MKNTLLNTKVRDFFNLGYIVYINFPTTILFLTDNIDDKFDSDSFTEYIYVDDETINDVLKMAEFQNILKREKTNKIDIAIRKSNKTIETSIYINNKNQ